MFNQLPYILNQLEILEEEKSKFSRAKSSVMNFNFSLKYMGTFW